MDKRCHRSRAPQAIGKSYSLRGEAWNRELAELLAQAEGIQLTPLHWEIIDLARSFFNTYQTAPSTRLLVKIVKQAHGPEKGNSLYLHRLFPRGPAQQLAKIAGLPKPVHCV